MDQKCDSAKCKDQLYFNYRLFIIIHTAGKNDDERPKSLKA